MHLQNLEAVAEASILKISSNRKSLTKTIPISTEIHLIELSVTHSLIIYTPSSICSRSESINYVFSSWLDGISSILSITCHCDLNTFLSKIAHTTSHHHNLGLLCRQCLYILALTSHPSSRFCFYHRYYKFW